MFVQVEEKAQGWRAVAVLESGVEALVFVGRSSSHVRSNYAEALTELFDEDERDGITVIRLQQWQGTPDAGKWNNKAELRMPAPKLVKMAA